MAIRCKLISPTNVLLEHPILSPVKESEFVLVGLNEFETEKMEAFRKGVFIGATIVAIIFAFAVLLGLERRSGSAENRPNLPANAFRMAQYPISSVFRPSGSQMLQVSLKRMSKLRKVRQIAS